MAARRVPPLIYALSLIDNLQAYLLGLEKRPKWIVGDSAGEGTSGTIAAYWRERWMKPRLANEEAMARAAGHTLVYPVTHGARVVLPREITEQMETF